MAKINFIGEGWRDMFKPSYTKPGTKKVAGVKRIARVDIYDNPFYDEFVVYVYPKHWKGKYKRLGSYSRRSDARRAANKYLEKNNLVAA